jgi:hypothetical protein
VVGARTLPAGLNQNRGFKHDDAVLAAALGLLAHGFKGVQRQLSYGCDERS